MRLKLPIIIVNFKSYKEGTGKRALKLAKMIERVSKKHEVSFGVAPQFCDIRMIVNETDLPVFSQHIDPIESFGAFTGHVTAYNVKEAGAIGTLINHSEKKLKLNDVKTCVNVARKLKLISIVCVSNLTEAKKILQFKPNFIAYEPPELIGSGRAVSKVKPDLVKKFVSLVNREKRKIIPLCGAGIVTGDDIKKALELGTKGVLVASSIVKSKNPLRVINSMVKALS